jgi:hypothetical protein
MRMNTGRILLGGLVAGVVANAIDYVSNEYVLAEGNNELMQRLGLNVDTVNASMSTWIAVDFVLGLLLVFTYAAMRPRFGPGPKTAIVSSITIWIGIAAVVAGFTAMGIFTQPMFMKSAALSLVALVAAGLAGAAIYRE